MNNRQLKIMDYKLLQTPQYTQTIHCTKDSHIKKKDILLIYMKSKKFQLNLNLCQPSIQQLLILQPNKQKKNSLLNNKAALSAHSMASSSKGQIIQQLVVALANMLRIHGSYGTGINTMKNTVTTNTSTTNTTIIIITTTNTSQTQLTINTIKNKLLVIMNMLSFRSK